MSATETRAHWMLDVSKLRESAEFGLRIGAKDMDGISAENYARDLLKAVKEIETLREWIASKERWLGVQLDGCVEDAETIAHMSGLALSRALVRNLRDARGALGNVDG